MYDLKNGQSLINETVQLSAQVMFLDGKYQDNKIILTIFMVSANGKIPAGSVTINPTSKVMGEAKLSLEKCPDRNALVYLEQSFEVVSVQLLQQESGCQNFSNSGRDNFRNLNNCIQKSFKGSLNSSVADILRRSRESRQNSLMDKDQIKQSKFSQIQSIKRVPMIQTSRGQLTRSKVDRVSTQKQDQMRLIYTREREEPLMVFDSGVSRVQSNYTLTNRYGNDSQEYQDQQMKIMRLEREKAEYIKELERLKGELEQINEFRVSYLQNELQRVKEECDSKEQEIMNYKDAIKEKEKVERELVLELRQFREEFDKRTFRLNTLQAKCQQNDRQLIKLKKQNQQTKQQNKRLKQQLDDLNLTLNSTQKKAQLQATSYKQQIKKLNEKYSLSESERQKATIELSNLLSQMQNSERKGQLITKQRQASFIDQTAKLMRKIDHLQEFKKKLEEDRQNDRQKIIELQKVVQDQRKTLQQEQSTVSRQSDELRELITKYSLSQKSLQETEKKLSQLELLYQEQKTVKKKKIFQLNQQLSTAKSELSLTLASVQELKKKSAQLQNSLSLQKSQYSSIDTRYTSLKKELDTMRREEGEKERLTETLTVQNQSQQQRINSLLEKLQQERITTQTLSSQYSAQLTYLQQTKLYLQDDLQDYRQALERQQLKTDLLQQQSTKLNEQILSLNQQLLVFVEKETLHEGKLKQLQYTNKTYLQQLTQFETKNKQLRNQLNTKTGQIRTLEKHIQKYSEKNQLLGQRISQLEKLLADKSQSVSYNIQEREKTLSQKSDQIQELTNSNQQMRSLIISLKQQVNQSKTIIKIKNQEHHELMLQNEQNHQLLLENEHILSEINSLRGELTKCKDQLSDNKQQNEKLKRELNQMEDEYKKQLQEKRQFEQQTREALRSLVQDLYQNYLNQGHHIPQNSNQQSDRPCKYYFLKSAPSSFGQKAKIPALRQFPDPKMCNLQQQIISRMNQMMNSFKSWIQSLQQELDMLRNQLSKVKQVVDQKQKEYQEEVLIQRQKMDLVLQEKINEINDLQNENNQLHQLLSEKDKQLNELKDKAHHQQQELELIYEELKVVSQQGHSYQEHAQELQKQLQITKLNYIKLSSECQDKIKQLNEQHGTSITEITYLNHQLNHQLESNYLKITQQLLTKQQQLASLSVRISELNQAEKQQAKLRDEHYKTIQSHQSHNQQLQKILNQKNISIQHLNYQHQSYQKEIQSLAAKCIQLTSISSSQLEQIHQLRVNNQKIEFQLRQLRGRYHQLEEQSKSQQLKTSTTINDLSHHLQTLSRQYTQLQSQYQLTKYNQQRNQSHLTQTNSILNKLTLQNNHRKQQLNNRDHQIDSLKHTITQLQAQLQTVLIDLASKQQQVHHLKLSLEQSQSIASQHQQLVNKTLSLQEEINRSQEQLFSNQSNFQQSLSFLQQGLVEAKKQLSFTSSKQQQHRRTLRTYQTQLQQKQHQINNLKHNLQSHSQQHQLQLTTQISSLLKQLQTQQQQHLFEKQHLQSDIQEKSLQIQSLQQSIASHQHILTQKEKQLHKKQKLITQLNSQLEVTQKQLNITQQKLTITEQKLSQSVEQWQKQKSTLHPTVQKLNQIRSQINRFQKFSKSIDLHSKQLIEISKRNSHLRSPDSPPTKGISDILREVALLCMKTKIKLLARCQNDKDKEVIISDYRLLHQKLDSAMNSHGVMKPIGFS